MVASEKSIQITAVSWTVSFHRQWEYRCCVACCKLDVCTCLCVWECFFYLNCTCSHGTQATQSGNIIDHEAFDRNNVYMCQRSRAVCNIISIPPSRVWVRWNVERFRWVSWIRLPPPTLGTSSFGACSRKEGSCALSIAIPVSSRLAPCPWHAGSGNTIKVRYCRVVVVSGQWCLSQTFAYCQDGACGSMVY